MTGWSQATEEGRGVAVGHCSGSGLATLSNAEPFYSQTMRTLWPGALTFLHANCFSESDDGEGGGDALA